MKTKQMDSITAALREKGFGYIAKDELRKLILIVHGEIVLDAVFAPLDEPKAPPVTLTVEQIKDLAEFAGHRLAESTTTDDEKETEITITVCPKVGVKEDDGSIVHYRHIAYFEEYPEEGVCPLGEQVAAPPGTDLPEFPNPESNNEGTN